MARKLKLIRSNSEMEYITDTLLIAIIAGILTCLIASWFVLMLESKPVDASSYMRQIETWAEAYDQEASAMSLVECEALYNDVFFEAMEKEALLIYNYDINN